MIIVRIILFLPPPIICFYRSST